MIVCRKINWLRRADMFRPWLFRVASRAAFRYLKKEQRWSDQIRDPEVLNRVRRRLRHLRQTPSADFFQSNPLPSKSGCSGSPFLEELTLPEIAAVLEVPLGTVKSRLAYGLATLRKPIATKE